MVLPFCIISLSLSVPVSLLSNGSMCFFVNRMGFSPREVSVRIVCRQLCWAPRMGPQRVGVLFATLPTRQEDSPRFWPDVRQHGLRNGGVQRQGVAHISPG